MCTLTYLPFSGGYALTHNRDERMDREASKVFLQQEIGGHTLFFPQDFEGKGSWFVHSTRATLCILNGGTDTYIPRPPYRHSRGLVLLHYFEYASAEAFTAHYNFDQLEPFTLIIAEEGRLYKLVHDEMHTHLLPLDASLPHIWSSTRLYTKEVRVKREGWFAQWLQNHQHPSAKTIRHFHLTGGEGDTANDFRMSRWGLLKTVSLTQVYKGVKTTSLYYHNFAASTPDLKILSAKL
jgi:hypothetical protein